MRDKNFILLVLGQAVSCMGSTLYSVVASLWAYEMTGSALFMSIVYSAANLARLVSFPFAGVIVDKFSRRNLIVLCDVICGFSMLAVATAALSQGKGCVWMLVIHSAITGAVSSIFSPSVNTLMLSITKKEHFVQANSVYNAIEYGVDIVGQGAAGGLYAILGAPMLFLLNGISYLFSAGSEIFITKDAKQEQSEKNPFLKEAVQGVRYILRNRGVGLNLLLAFCINFVFGVLNVVLIPWMLNFGETYFGLLGSFRSAGVIIGTLLLAAKNIPIGKHYSVYFWCQVAFVVCIALAATMSSFAPIAVLFCIAYINQYIFNSIQRSAVIIAAPDKIRGKVICAIQALAMGFSSLGNLFGGVAGSVMSPQPLVFMLMISLLAVIAFLGRNKCVKGLFQQM